MSTSFNFLIQLQIPTQMHMLSPSGPLEALSQVKKIHSQWNSFSRKFSMGTTPVWGTAFGTGLVTLLEWSHKKHGEQMDTGVIKLVFGCSILFGTLTSTLYFIKLHQINTHFDKIVEDLTRIANSAETLA